MMKKQNKKRGFTILELTIVVSVIAILSAVLIPTFAGIINRANRSADEQAVASMNTALVAADEDVDTIEEVVAYLATEGYQAGTYAPLSKDYSLYYSASLNKVLLYSTSAQKIVYPKEYANCTDAVAIVNSNGEVSENLAADTAADFASKGGIATISADTALEAPMYVTKSLTVNLAANVSIPNDTIGDGVFCAKKGTLTFNGEGTVDGAGNNYYCMAVWANSGEVVINGGTYTNAKATEIMGEIGPDGTICNYDLIYVSNGGKVTINGGTFIGANPEYTLNVKDVADAGSIEVKGGKFYKYNPANAKDATITIAEGYEAVQEGDWWIVQAIAA